MGYNFLRIDDTKMSGYYLDLTFKRDSGVLFFLLFLIYRW